MTPRVPGVALAALLLTLLPQAAAPPKLVVLLMVDQMRADYLDRYGGFLEQGIKRLTTDGASYTNAALPYMNTVTCVGHSTASTGTFPYQHGMINNAWILYGPCVRAGRYDTAASTADIAVTLGARVGVTIPSPDGHVLTPGSAGSR